MQRLSATSWALALGLAAAACGSKKPATTTAGSAAGSDLGGVAGTDPGAEPGGTSTPDDGAGGSAALPPGVTADNVTLAAVGLEADSLDRTADPCTDFYQFACGGWMAKTEIPADKARWGRFGEITDQNESVLHTILDDARALKGKGDPILVKLGNFYGSCMDEGAIEKAGLGGVKPFLDLAAKVKDAKSLAKAFVALHVGSEFVAFGHNTDADKKDSLTNALYLDSSGLGLPDRDYYLKDDFKAKRDAYHEHLVRLFGLLGQPAAKAATSADDVMFIETELAKVTKTGVERRDDQKMYNPMTVAELSKLAPSIDWPGYLKAIGSPGLKNVIVTTPAYLTGLDALMHSAKPAQWTAYLTARIVDDSAFTLPKKFDDEAFALAKVLSGVEQQRDRWKRCADATAGAMPEYLGQPFVAKMFPGASKDFAVKLFQAIAGAMDQNFAGLDWMTDATKAKAHSKLGKLAPMIGYPDTWKKYEFAVKPTTFAANAIAAGAHEAKYQAGKAGKPFDRNEWLMAAFIVNAYYNPGANNTALPAGILEPPFFGADRSIAVNLGGIGMVVGHEMTHGFDDQGANYDEEGRLANWWQPDDLQKFQAKGQCLSKQYSSFEVLPGKFVNGDLTLGENIADSGGVKLAFNAYRALRAGATKVQVADGFTEDQQFFLAVGQSWCSKDRPEESIRRITVDPHSPPKFRVFGALRNFPAFAKAFQCKEGAAMHPKNSCTIW